MRRYPQYVLRHPKRVLAIWAMVFMAAGFFMVLWPQIKINPTFKSMIMTDDPDRAFDKHAKDTFGDDEIIVIAVEDPQGVVNIKSLETIDRITEAVKALEGVKDVFSLTDIDDIRGTESGTVDAHDLIEELPKTAEDMQKVLKDLDDNPTYANTIISKDKKVASINVELARTHTEPHIQAGVTKKILQIVHDEEKRSNTHIRVTGFPVASMIGGEMMLGDMVIFGAISCMFLFVVIWILFRKFQPIVFSMIVANVGVSVTYAAMSIMGVPVTMPLSAVMVFVMAIGLEYAIHVGYSYNQEILDAAERGHKVRDHKFAISEGLRMVKPALVFSGITTAIGFFSMMTNPVPDLVQMGLFLAIGSIVLIFASLTLVPAIIALWPYKVEPIKESELLHRVVSACTESAIKRPMVHIALMVVLVAGSVVGWIMLSSDTDAMQYFKDDARISKDEKFVRSHMAGTTYLQAVVDGPAVDTFKEPENLAKLAVVADYAATLPHVTKVISHADHIKLLNKALHEGKADEYKLPPDKTAVEQYLLLHNDPDDFRTVVESDYKQTSILIRMDTMSSTVLLDVEAKVEAKIREVFPATFKGNLVGTTLLAHRAFNEMSGAMVQGLAIAVGIAWLLMFLFLKSFKLATLSLLPNIIPIGMNYAFLGLIGHPIDPPAAVTGAIALGLSVDDTTHMFWTWLRYTRQHGYTSEEAVRLTMKETGRPIVMKTLVVSLGFCVLMASQYGTLVWMGLMLGVVGFNGMAWDLLVTPALLRVIKEKARNPSAEDLKQLVDINKTKMDPNKTKIADYTDDEIGRMMTYDFFAIAGKTIIRQGGRFGTRRLLYELDLKPGMKVLEYGTGVGANAFTLVKDYAVHVTGVDLSEFMVEQSKKNAAALGIGDLCTFVTCSETKLPFPDNTFDVVMAEAVVMYTNANITLAEIFRVLKPGGKFGFHDWSWMSEPVKELEQLSCVMACGCNINDLKWYTKDGWDEKMRAKGFEVGFSHDYPFNFFSWDSMVDDEGTWNVIKMFGGIMKRPAAFKKMLRIMGFLSKFEGNFGYIISVNTKPWDKSAELPAGKTDEPAAAAAAE